ncbi:MAG: ubiquinol-cytochrome c reductase iron-sulfur subunit [Bryobacteraceae bacterium]|nr:ubiquinol-cytochrome c reductase iron-sulfur subunit [Bryobacteraceae bacterium]
MSLDRRQFQQGIIAVLGAVMTAALTIPAVAYLFATPRSRKKQGWIDAADVSQLPMNSPEEVVFRRVRMDGWKMANERTTAWVVRTGASEVIALAPQCTHLGCAYHWAAEQKEFHCPCHTSAFSMDGKVLSGPAPRALDRYQVKVENSRVLLGEVERNA